MTRLYFVCQQTSKVPTVPSLILWYKKSYHRANHWLKKLFCSQGSRVSKLPRPRNQDRENRRLWHDAVDVRLGLLPLQPPGDAARTLDGSWVAPGRHLHAEIRRVELWSVALRNHDVWQLSIPGPGQQTSTGICQRREDYLTAIKLLRRPVSSTTSL